MNEEVVKWEDGGETDEEREEAEKRQDKRDMKHNYLAFVFQSLGWSRESILMTLQQCDTMGLTEEGMDETNEERCDREDEEECADQDSPMDERFRGWSEEQIRRFARYTGFDPSFKA